jgi:hypothetical protein
MPTLGVTPPVLVGRAAELQAFREALAQGPGSPARAMVVTGPRGTGKTVLLNAVERAAAQSGWVVAAVTTRPGMAAELTHTELPRLLADGAADVGRPIRSRPGLCGRDGGR